MIEENKTKIKELLLSTKRQSVGELVEYLEKKTDFFTAPASTDFHNNIEGGLAAHSLKVYEILRKKVKDYNLIVPDDSIIICGLLHDVCKTNYYAKTIKSVVEGKIKKSFPVEKDVLTGQVIQWGEREVKNWIDKEVWMVKDLFPAGHGEKSVFIIQWFIKLLPEEILAIRWHMVAFDAGIHFDYPSGYPFRKAITEYPLVTLLFTADFEVSNILEKVEDGRTKINSI